MPTCQRHLLLSFYWKVPGYNEYDMNNSDMLSETEKTGMFFLFLVGVCFLRFLGWPIVKHNALDGSQAWLHSVLIANSRHKEAYTGESRFHQYIPQLRNRLLFSIWEINALSLRFLFHINLLHMMSFFFPPSWIVFCSSWYVSNTLEGELS